MIFLRRIIIITPTSLPILTAIVLTCSEKFNLSSIMMPKSFMRLVGSIGAVSSMIVNDLIVIDCNHFCIV